MEEKEKKTKKSHNFNALTIILIILIVLVVVLIVIQMATGGISELFNSSTVSVGNSIGNIRNYGYLASDGEYLYYMSPNENGGEYAIGIYKTLISDPSGDKEVLLRGDWEVLSLNYMDGYLYFITMADGDEASDEDEDVDTVDNKIYKMSIDGGEVTVLNDNEFHNNCYEIYVVKNKIYYIGEDECIYYMNLDGSNKTKLNDDGFGYMGITEDYIFYTRVEEVESEDSEEMTTRNVTYMMDLDGNDSHAVIEGEYLYNISVIDDYIYYQTENGYPSKVKLDGTDSTMLSDTVAYSMIATEDGIFYYNYFYSGDTLAGVGLYRMDLDGENATLLKKLDDYSLFLNVIDNWLFLADDDTEEGRFELISTDGDQTVVLFRMDISEYYDEESEEDSEENDEESSDEDDTYIIDEDDVIYSYDVSDEEESEE